MHVSHTQDLRLVAIEVCASHTLYISMGLMSSHNVELDNFYTTAPLSGAQTEKHETPSSALQQCVAVMQTQHHTANNG